MPVFWPSPSARSSSRRESTRESWLGFGEDPEWTTMREESRRDGPIVTNVESVFLHPTDFSPAR